MLKINIFWQYGPRNKNGKIVVFSHSGDKNFKVSKNKVTEAKII